KVRRGKGDARYSLKNDLIWFDRTHLVIPESLKLKILKDHHDAPLAGHPGKRVTRDLITCYYHWPHIDQDIESYISSCELCQRNKDSTQRPGGLLTPLPIPSYPWESISMDFITHLPKSKSGHDAITVFVDRLTKMVHLSPAKSTNTGKDIV